MKKALMGILLAAGMACGVRAQENASKDANQCEFEPGGSDRNRSNEHRGHFGLVEFCAGCECAGERNTCAG